MCWRTCFFLRRMESLAKGIHYNICACARKESNGRLKENTEIRKGIVWHPGLGISDIRVSARLTSGSRYARHPGVGHKKKANRTNGTGRKQYGNIQGKEIQTERRQRKRYKKTTAQQKNRHRKLEKGGRQPGKHEASHNPTNLLKEDARCIKC